MSFQEPFAITESKVRSIVDSLNTSYDQKIFKEYGLYAYQLPKGGVVVDHGDWGELHPSLDNVKAACVADSSPTENTVVEKQEIQPLDMDILMQNVKKISKEETQNLIGNLKGQHNKKAMYDFGIYAYELVDGRAVVDWEDFGRLYPSFDEVLRVSQAIKYHSDQLPSSSHILSGIFPHDHNFPEQAEELASKTLRILNIQDFKYDLKSLKKVDKALNDSLGEQPSDYSAYNDLYPGLVAIIGKVLIKEIPNAKWEMYQPEDEDIWEPYVKNEKGETYNPFLLVYKELYEYHFEEHEPVALFDHVQVELIQYKIPTE